MAKGPNPAMRSKRVHGPSAQYILCMHVALERCKEPGCKNPVVATRNPDGITKVRACIDHISTGMNARKGGFKTSDLLKFPWQA